MPCSFRRAAKRLAAGARDRRNRGRRIHSVGARHSEMKVWIPGACPPEGGQRDLFSRFDSGTVFSTLSVPHAPDVAIARRGHQRWMRSKHRMSFAKDLTSGERRGTCDASGGAAKLAISNRRTTLIGCRFAFRHCNRNARSRMTSTKPTRFALAVGEACLERVPLDWRISLGPKPDITLAEESIEP